MRPETYGALSLAYRHSKKSYYVKRKSKIQKLIHRAQKLEGFSMYIMQIGDKYLAINGKRTSLVKIIQANCVHSKEKLESFQEKYPEGIIRDALSNLKGKLLQ